MFVCFDNSSQCLPKHLSSQSKSNSMHVYMCACVCVCVCVIQEVSPLESVPRACFRSVLVSGY